LLQGAASLFSLAQHCVAGSLAAFFVSEVYTSLVSSMSPPDVDSARHAGLFSFCRVASAGLSFESWPNLPCKSARATAEHGIESRLPPALTQVALDQTAIGEEIVHPSPGFGNQSDARETIPRIDVRFVTVRGQTKRLAFPPEHSPGKSESSIRYWPALPA
jgi:hypothetical protein